MCAISPLKSCDFWNMREKESRTAFPIVSDDED